MPKVDNVDNYEPVGGWGYEPFACRYPEKANGMEDGLPGLRV